MKKLLICFFCILSISMYAQYTSEYTGVQIDSGITLIRNINSNLYESGYTGAEVDSTVSWVLRFTTDVYWTNKRLGINQSDPPTTLYIRRSTADSAARVIPFKIVPHGATYMEIITALYNSGAGSMVVTPASGGESAPYHLFYYAGVSTTVGYLDAWNCSAMSTNKIWYNDGDVGIGTTSPDIKLAVNGAYNYYADTSTVADSIKLGTNDISALTTGMQLFVKILTANTGATSLRIANLTPKLIKKKNDQDLASGDIEVGQIVHVIYDGTYFQMLSQLAQ